MVETITMAGMDALPPHTPGSTGGGLTMFEMRLSPGSRISVPHHHRDWEETLYGLAGTTAWTVDGLTVEVGPGDSVHIPRGIVHGFTNGTAEAASCLCVLTPGVLGPAYLREIAAPAAGAGRTRPP